MNLNWSKCQHYSGVPSKLAFLSWLGACSVRAMGGGEPRGCRSWPYRLRASGALRWDTASKRRLRSWQPGRRKAPPPPGAPNWPRVSRPMPGYRAEMILAALWRPAQAAEAVKASRLGGHSSPPRGLVHRIDKCANARRSVPCSTRRRADRIQASIQRGYRYRSSAPSPDTICRD